MRYDLRQGLQRRNYLIATLLFSMRLFAVYRSVQFYCHVESISSRGSIGDYMLCLFRGMAIMQHGSMEEKVSIPIEWLIVCGFCLYITAAYPAQGISVQGQQVFLRTSRVKWWLSKCICCYSNTSGKGNIGDRQMKGKKKFWLIFSVAAVVLFVWIIRYKAINQDYRQRWSSNTEKTYSVGEIVPIAPDFVGYNLAAEGYMLQVNRFEIVDYRAYTSALQYDGTDRSRIPDKIALVSVTVSQQNSSAEGFPLTELSLYTTDMLMNMDWDLLGVVNPILDGATGIRLQDGASCDILLPFDLYRYRFTSSEWNGLEQSSIWLQVTNYPTRKIIQVNIGEE